jgi:Protein of unknown function (DUF2846)
MKLLRLLIGCTLALSLSACASGIKFTEMKPSLSPSTQEVGRIFFYRPVTLGAALQPDILVNGRKVGESAAWGFFHIDRPAGNYEVATSTEVERKVSFVLEKGQTRYVRFSVSMGFFVGHVYGELVDQATALPELEECKYAGQASVGQ